MLSKKKVRKKSLVICTDLEKVFDSVNHNALLIKITYLGIKGNILNWTCNFLKEKNISLQLDKRMGRHLGFKKKT